MSAWWKPIRDRLQRAVFNQEREVLQILVEAAECGTFSLTYGGHTATILDPSINRWMTYIEISFASRGRVSSDNALTVLYHLRDDLGDEPLVDFAIRRDGEVGSFWAINANGRKWLEDGR